MEISFVVPMYNEEENILPLLEKLEKTVKDNQYTEYEFIFINDGSTDSTGKILNELGHCKTNFL